MAIDPERLRKIDDVFQAALDIAPQSRIAFIAESCAGDADLRQEIESLLLSHDRAGEFIEMPASQVAAEWLAHNDLSGSDVDKYRILSRIAAGGMGEIYLAVDAQLGRKVALKFLPPYSSGSDEGARRLRREAEAASALNHPNVLTVYEFGCWRGRNYIATEYVDGVTLRTRIRGKPLSPAVAIDVAQQIANALSAANAAGIIHRDIKPENVMLRRDGLVKVLDFGIAKVADVRRPSDGMTATTGGIVGTTAYMSPEQARGLALDGRTDVWSLGVVLFEMITGQLPFPGKTSSDRIAAILEREPQRIGHRRRQLPEVLEPIVRRALAKAREDRYPRVGDMAEELRNVRASLERDAPKGLVLSALVQTFQSRRKIAFGLITASLLLVGAVISTRFVGGGAGALTTTIQSLAVLPLANVGSSPGTEYLSDGMTDSLIDSLSKLRDLKVMSRTSVFRYKNHEVDPRTVGNALGVQAVLTGRVLQRDDSIFLSVELVDARDDSHLWGGEYHRATAALPALQADLTHDVLLNLRSRISGAEERRLTSAPVNPQAYERYLKGRYYVLKATRPDIETGVSYLRQAIDIAPSYALAYVGLADAYRVLALAGESPATEELPRAKAAAMKAVEIDEQLGEAHGMLGFVIFWSDWNWLEAERHLKRSLELDPNSAYAHEAYAHVLTYTGRHGPALAEIRRAAELDPLNLRIGALEGAFLINAGRPDEALAKLRQTLELNPDYWFARQYEASAYIDAGMFPEAIAAARRAQELSGASTRPTAFLGYALAKSGRQTQARAELKHLLQLSAVRYVSPYNVAMIYEGLNQHDEALAWLERGYREREPRMVFLESEPKWKALRGAPGFQDLLHRVGFTR